VSISGKDFQIPRLPNYSIAGIPLRFPYPIHQRFSFRQKTSAGCATLYFNLMDPSLETPPVETPPVTSLKKSGRGCLMLMIFGTLAAIVFGFALTAIFSPWGFFMGGRFHLYPQWQGWGRLHSSTAGDFVLFVRIVPGSGARHGGPQVKGSGVLCTPRGEKYNLNVAGEFERHFGLDFQGRSVVLGMSNSSFIERQMGRYLAPKLQLFGKWDNPNLVMDDRGSLSHAFEPDGSLYTGNFKNRPNTRETVPVTLREGPRSDFDAACAAAKVK